MLRIIGLVVVVAVVYLFINWEEHSDDVTSVVETVDEVAEQTSELREEIKDKAEDFADKLND